MILRFLDWLIGFDRALGLLERALAILGRLPTTELRVWTTLAVFVYTAIRLDPPHWDPGWDWYLFLAAMAGLDVTQWVMKRKTHKAELAPASASAGPAT